MSFVSRNCVWASLSLVLALVSCAVAQPAATQAVGGGAKATDVPVRVVVLFSSGVGYFEHSGTVTGSGSTELRFKTSQINDILKSLVLQDLNGGRVSTVTYPSQDPLAKTLRSFQVDITANPSLGDLLNQLRGAKVRVSWAGEELHGTILGLEKRPKAVDDKGHIDVWVLNLIDGGTIRSVELDAIQKLELEDLALQEELAKALTALSQARDQDKKPVTVNFIGDGERQVRIGYVVETPVWKTSYRLLLPAAADGAPKLQGWAIVENQTDNDWNNVDLSLVSGRPISFIEDLYQPLYVPRPVVRPQLYEGLTAQTYEQSVSINNGSTLEFDREAGQDRMTQKAMNGALLRVAGRGGSPEAASAPMDAAASVQSLASAMRIGELFEYNVGNVSLARQRSAMIPIITDAVQAERLSIYNASVLPRNPLNGARLTNSTGKHLLGGPITVLDGANYAGDANIDDLPPGQNRLISYGVDLQVIVDATHNQVQDSVETGKIVKGVLWLQHKYVFHQDYAIENKSDHEKTIVIEHPRRGGGWNLVDTDKPVESTDALYRFQSKVAAGKSSSVKVQEQLVQDEEFAILPADVGQLDFYARTGTIPAAVRDVLTKAMSLKNALVDTQRQIDQKQQELNQIAGEQGRIRENMKTVQPNGAYYTRLLAKLNVQETSIEKLHGEMDTLRATMEQQRKDLESFLANTTVGG